MEQSGVVSPIREVRWNGVIEILEHVLLGIATGVENLEAILLIRIIVLEKE